MFIVGHIEGVDKSHNRKFRGSSSRLMKKHVPNSTSIGKSLVSQSHPSSIDYYWFIVNQNTLLNTFDFVTVNNLRHTKSIGIVQDITAEVLSHGRKTSLSELDNIKSLSKQGERNDIEQAIIAKVAIIGNTGVRTSEGRSYKTVSVNFPVAAGNDVRFSTEEEVLFSLGVPKMETPISAGIMEMSNGLQIPISLDLTYLAGPDTAHVNVSGISGNRKSSYILFLLQSAYQTLRDVTKSHENVCLIIFNTKEDDLLYLDQKKEKRDIGIQAKKAFEILDLHVEAFDNVTYFLPRGKDGKPNSLHIPKYFKTYSFELKDIYDKLDLLFTSTLDQRDTLPIVNFIRESWPLQDSSGKIISNWTDISRFTEYPQSIISHKSSFLDFISQIQRFRGSPMFVDGKVKSVYLGDEIKKIDGNDIFVIDIAPLSSVEEQAFIIGDVLRNINGLYSVRYPFSEEKIADTSQKSHYQNYGRHRIGKLPSYIFIFLDEINRFIPKVHYSPKLNPVSEEIMKLVIGGRSRGNILFSAQQFKSNTDYRFQENIDLRIFAKLGLSELLTAPYYSMIDEGVKKNIARLERGEMVLVHSAFRHPLKIWFPPASYKRR